MEMLIQCHGLKDQLGVYMCIYIPCTLNYKRKNDMCIHRHLCCCFTFLFRCTYFPFSCWILECTFLKSFFYKIKSYLLVGHYMVLLAIHTHQKQQQQQLDCLDWLPYLPTSDINLSSMYLLSPMLIIFFFFFFFRERVPAHGLWSIAGRPILTRYDVQKVDDMHVK